LTGRRPSKGRKKTWASRIRARSGRHPSFHFRCCARAPPLNDSRERETAHSGPEASRTRPDNTGQAGTVAPAESDDHGTLVYVLSNRKNWGRPASTPVSRSAPPPGRRLGWRRGGRPPEPLPATRGACGSRQEPAGGPGTLTIRGRRTTQAPRAMGSPSAQANSMRSTGVGGDRTDWGRGAWRRRLLVSAPSSPSVHHRSGSGRDTFRARRTFFCATMATVTKASLLVDSFGLSWGRTGGR